MSLQTRLAALIAAIGADIKSLAAGKADAAKGVTNGDAHDHSGGDGAQIAYSSLSGLPTLGTAAPLNVAASGNAAAGEVVKGNDTRLSDSREWTATKVTQAEAEEGTGTTDRKWDALRVRQAIAAWWNSVSTVAGRALVGAADAAAQRDALGVSNHNLVAVDSTGNLTLATGKSLSGMGTEGGFSVGLSVPAGGISIKGIRDTGTAYGDFDPIPSDGTSAANLRLFRSVNTTGDASVIIYYGNGTSQINHLLNGKSTASSLCRANGNLLVGKTTDDGTYKTQINGSLTAGGPVRIGQYTLATLPSASVFAVALIDVTDATGGPKTCRSNGTDWKILNTNTTVS